MTQVSPCLQSSRKPQSPYMPIIDVPYDVSVRSNNITEISINTQTGQMTDVDPQTTLHCDVDSDSDAEDVSVLYNGISKHAVDVTYCPPSTPWRSGSDTHKVQGTDIYNDSVTCASSHPYKETSNNNKDSNSEYYYHVHEEEYSTRCDILELYQHSFFISLLLPRIEEEEMIVRITTLYQQYLFERELLLEGQFQLLETVMRRGIVLASQRWCSALGLFLQSIPSEEDVISAMCEGSISEKVAMLVIEYHSRHGRYLFPIDDMHQHGRRMKGGKEDYSVNFWTLMFSEAIRKEQKRIKEIYKERGVYYRFRSILESEGIYPAPNATNEEMDTFYTFHFNRYYEALCASSDKNPVTLARKPIFKVSTVIDRKTNNITPNFERMLLSRHYNTVLREMQLLQREIQDYECLSVLMTVLHRASHRTPQDTDVGKGEGDTSQKYRSNSYSSNSSSRNRSLSAVRSPAILRDKLDLYTNMDVKVRPSSSCAMIPSRPTSGESHCPRRPYTSSNTSCRPLTHVCLSSQSKSTPNRSENDPSDGPTQPTCHSQYPKSHSGSCPVSTRHQQDLLNAYYNTFGVSNSHMPAGNTHDIRTTASSDCNKKDQKGITKKQQPLEISYFTTHYARHRVRRKKKNEAVEDIGTISDPLLSPEVSNGVDGVNGICKVIPRKCKMEELHSALECQRRNAKEFKKATGHLKGTAQATGDDEEIDSEEDNFSFIVKCRNLSAAQLFDYFIRLMKQEDYAEMELHREKEYNVYRVHLDIKKAAEEHKAQFIKWVRIEENRLGLIPSCLPLSLAPVNNVGNNYYDYNDIDYNYNDSSYESLANNIIDLNPLQSYAATPTTSHSSLIPSTLNIYSEQFLYHAFYIYLLTGVASAGAFNYTHPYRKAMRESRRIHDITHANMAYSDGNSKRNSIVGTRQEVSETVSPSDIQRRKGLMCYGRQSIRLGLGEEAAENSLSVICEGLLKDIFGENASDLTREYNDNVNNDEYSIRISECCMSLVSLRPAYHFYPVDSALWVRKMKFLLRQ